MIGENRDEDGGETEEVKENLRIPWSAASYYVIWYITLKKAQKVKKILFGRLFCCNIVSWQ